jgi:hypothetical protein
LLCRARSLKGGERFGGDLSQFHFSGKRAKYLIF